MSGDSIGFSEATLEATEDYARYRTLSVSAVVTMIFAILSLPSLIIAPLLFLPAIGSLVGLVTLRSLRGREHEFTGIGMARVGTLLCAICLVGGIGLATYVYYTEVPEGLTRISFADLQKDPEHPEYPFRQSALELHGKRVFVKGYILSNEKTSNLTSFILVPDLGTCCFGGQPKLNDMIEVKLKSPLRTQFSYMRRKLGGTFIIDPRFKRDDGVDGGHFKLEADYLR